jgi:DNA-binding NtrC family response regulator
MAKRILVAEDEIVTLRNICVFLRHEGYEVHEAKDGAEALHLLDTSKFDLVISDVLVDGVGVGSHLRAVAPDTPFIAITGYPNEALGLSEMSNAACITKPILLDELKEQIEQAIG